MKKLRGESGQSMVEFAIVIVFLLFFLMGIFEFSWLMGNKLLATNASREGARYAAVHDSTKGSWTGDTQNIVKNLLVKNASTYVGYSVTVTKKNDSVLGDYVEVNVKYNVPHISGFIPSAVIPNPFPISATTKMRMEN